MNRFMQGALFSVLTFGFLGMAQADVEEFEKLSKEVAAKCNFEEGRCRAPYFAVNYGPDDFKQLSARVRRELRKVMDYERNVWGDTIFEGDYTSDDDVDAQMDFITVVKSGRDTILYHIQYSEMAYDVSGRHCQFNEETDRYDLTTCTAGRISAGNTVSVDFKYHSVASDKDYPEFHPY